MTLCMLFNESKIHYLNLLNKKDYKQTKKKNFFKLKGQTTISLIEQIQN